MALVKPFINRISAFDATQGSQSNIVLSILGGDRIKSITYFVYNNSTNEQVLENTIEVNDIEVSDIRNFIIPNISNLINNFSYYITAYTSNDNENSPYTNNTIFQCYKEPSLTATYRNTNIDIYEKEFTSGITLNSENCYLTLNFNKNDINSNAELNYAKVIVYGILDNKKYKTFESNYVYVEPYEIIVTKLIPTLTTNDNKKFDSYTFEFYGMTTEYMEFKTIINNVKCNYSISSENAYFSLYNNYQKGYIEINVDISNLIEEKIVNNIARIDIKRRIVNTENYIYVDDYEWITLLSIYKDSDDDIEKKFIVFDTYNANNVLYEYKISLYDNDGNENYPKIQQVLSQFNGNYICDYNEIYNITYEFETSGNERIQKSVIYEPYGSKYPFVAYNADTDYNQGQITTVLLANNEQYIDRYAQLELTKKFNNFLSNKMAKILKLYNGDILIISIYNNISNSYYKQLGNGICSTSFNYVEVGEMTESSMSKLGMLGNFELHYQE